MKTARFSLAIAIAVAVLSLFQFERYQKFVNNTQATLAQVQDNVHHQTNHLETALNQLKKTNEDLLARTQNPSFKTAQLEYLIRVASTQLEATRQTEPTVKLLTLAQTQIQSLNDPSLSLLSEAISRDLDALEKAGLPNLTARWLQVNTLIEQTNGLLPESAHFDKAEEQRPAATPQQDATQAQAPSFFERFKRRLLASLVSMKEVIKIRQTHQLEPILVESQKVLVEENLRLLLTQIQFSILNTEQNVFEASIKNTQQWLDRYYDATNTTVQETQKQLAGLLTVQLRPTLPKITAVDFFNTLR